MVKLIVRFGCMCWMHMEVYGFGWEGDVEHDLHEIWKERKEKKVMYPWRSTNSLKSRLELNEPYEVRRNIK